MFINTKVCFEVISDNGTKFNARAGWIGEVPEWVQSHWYFKSLCKDGSVTAIVKNKQTTVPEAPAQETKTANNGDNGDSELYALRTRAAELKISHSARMGKDKLISAISEAEAKLNPPDLLANMDAPALREFAASNKIDLTDVSDEATADELRAVIKAAPTSEES
jgi:hypothetical protein